MQSVDADRPPLIAGGNNLSPQINHHYSNSHSNVQFMYDRQTNKQNEKIWQNHKFITYFVWPVQGKRERERPREKERGTRLYTFLLILACCIQLMNELNIGIFGYISIFGITYTPQSYSAIEQCYTHIC